MAPCGAVVPQLVPPTALHMGHLHIRLIRQSEGPFSYPSLSGLSNLFEAFILLIQSSLV
jgi:hypothetical protein